MKTKKLLPVIFCLLSAAAFIPDLCVAQTAGTQPATTAFVPEKGLPHLIPFRKGRSMGYSDSTKKVIVKPVYSKTYPLVNGLGRVMAYNQMGGFINAAGVEIAKPVYILPWEPGKEFKNGRCLVQSREKWSSTTAGEYREGPNAYGFLDEQGREVVKPQYAYANHFQHGLAVVSTDMYHYGHINREGIVVTPIAFTQNGVDKHSGQFNNGVAIVTKHSAGMAMLDTLGRHILPGFYAGIRPVSEGYYQVSKLGEPHKIVNAKGEVVLQGAVVNEFKGDYALVQFTNGKNGFVDKSCKVVATFSDEYVSPTFGNMHDSLDYVYGYYDGLAAVALSNARYTHGYIDKQGKIAISPNQDFFTASPFRQGRAKVSKHNVGYGFIDKTGKPITPMKYELAANFRDGRAWVMKDNKYGFIDRSGKEIIPLQYDYQRDPAGYFVNGLFVVRKADKYGVIDTLGRELVPVKFDHFTAFEDGLVKARLHTRYGLFNTEGREVLPPVYTQIATGHKQVIAAADGNGNWALFDKQGKPITEHLYSKLNLTQNPLIQVADKQGRWGLIDASGKVAVPIKYGYLHGNEFSAEGLLQVELFGDIPGSAYQNFYIDYKGTEYYAP